MTQATSTHTERPALTAPLAAFAAGLDRHAIPAEAATVARHCLLDWLGVALAGAAEPLTGMLAAQAAVDGGTPQATLVGRAERVTASQATLVNGAASHALDFDDVLQPLRGHPTVPVLPGLLALTERDGLSGADLLVAFIAGVETEARVGIAMGDDHYNRGWHATGTVGTFGAAAAAARLLGLDADAMATALGIAGTQAAGLKAMFGTMCKPLHAGKAAQNGLLAAELARRGFTSRRDVLDCAQGFPDAETAAFDPEGALDGLGSRFHTPNVLFKYHPACYGTHAPMEAARAIAAHPAFAADKVDRIDIRIHPKSLTVCNIQNPATGLEAKFSLRYNVGLALAGGATGALSRYEDAHIGDPAVVALQKKGEVAAHPSVPSSHQAEIIVHLQDGLVLRETADVGKPATDLDAQWAKLATKFRALAEPVIGAAKADEIVARVADLEGQGSLAPLLALTRPH